MSIEQGNLTFEGARKSGDSLSKIEREIKQAEIKNKTKEDLSSLRNSISDELITKLYGEGMKVVSGDALHHINHITLKKLHIKWYDGKLNKKDDANDIWPGDTIKIEGNKAFRYHNDKKTEIGEVEKKKEDSAVAKSPEKKQGTPPLKPNNPKKSSNPPTNQKGQNPTITPPNSPSSPSINPQTKENHQTTETMTFRDGKIFLVGKDGVEVEYNRELTPKMKETIKKYEKVAILNSILKIWISKAKSTAKGIIGKIFRDDDEIIEEKVQNVENILSGIFNKISAGNSNIENDINKIFENISKAEDEESIIGSNDMENVKSTLDSNLTKDQKLLKTYNLMRYKGLSGNSSGVKEEVSNHLLQDKRFEDISNILNNEKIIGYISEGKDNELNNLIKDKELSKELIETYNKIKSRNEKHRSEYQTKLLEINKERKKAGIVEMNVDDYIKNSTNMAMLHILKNTLLKRKIENIDLRGGENDTYVGLYANMSGLSENKGVYDYLTISDDNIDTAIDIGATLALSAVSMGVGMIAARAAMGLVGLAQKTAIGARMAQSSIKGAGLARFAGSATLEGYSFYEGTNIMNNAFYSKGSIFENGGNLKEIAKSIAFMGVLKGVGKVMKSAQLAKGVTSGGADIGFSGNSFAKFAKLTDKVPPLMFKGISITGVLAEAGLLTGTGVGIEVAFEGEGEWTWGEYMQAIVMVGLFRGVGKIKFSKGKNGELIEEQSPKVKIAKIIYKTEIGAENALNQLKIDKPKNTYKIQENNGKYHILKSPKVKIAKIIYKTEIGAENALNQLKIDKPKNTYKIQENNGKYHILKSPKVKTKITPQEETQILEKNFKDLLYNKTNQLKDGGTIKVGKYTITKKGEVFELNKGTESETYSDLNKLINGLKISRFDKINTSLETKGEQLVNKANEILIGNNMKLFKKNDGTYSIHKDGKEIKADDLSNSDANKVLKALYPEAKLDNLNNIFPDVNFDAFTSNISSKLTGKAKEAFDKSIQSVKNSASSGGDFATKLLWKGFGDGPFLSKGELGLLVNIGATGYFSQEQAIGLLNSFTDDKEKILTLKNAGNLGTILANYFILSKIGIVRTLLYDKIADSIFPKEYNDIIL